MDPPPYALQVCLQFLTGLTHRPFTPLAVKGGDKVDLGQVCKRREGGGGRGEERGSPRAGLQGGWVG